MVLATKIEFPVASWLMNFFPNGEPCWPFTAHIHHNIILFSLNSMTYTDWGYISHNCTTSQDDFRAIFPGQATCRPIWIDLVSVTSPIDLQNLQNQMGKHQKPTDDLLFWKN